MSLEGTLETIALPDVLALLSVTAKTGELRIEAGGGVGSVWFDAGAVAGFDVGSQRTAVDSLFALLRLREGSFKFYTGTAPVNAIQPEDVAPILEEAESRLVQWPAIAAAVPSIYCEVHLAQTVDGTVMLRPDQWRLVATIGDGRAVADVLEARELSEFDGCKAVKELVDLRLVQVAAPKAVPSVPDLSPRPAQAPDLSAHAHAHAHELSDSTIEDEPSVAAAVEDVDVPTAVHAPNLAELEEPAPAVGAYEPAEEPDAAEPVESLGSYAAFMTPSPYPAPASYEDPEPYQAAAAYDAPLSYEPPASFEVAETYEAAEAYAPEPFEVPRVAYHSDEPVAEVDWSVPEVPDLPEIADLSEVWDDEAGMVRRVNMDTLDSVGTAPAPEPEVEAEPEVPAADPVNRGLLLKFLGSARN